MKTPSRKGRSFFGYIENIELCFHDDFKAFLTDDSINIAPVWADFYKQYTTVWKFRKTGMRLQNRQRNDRNDIQSRFQKNKKCKI